ncbi:ATP-dependent nuclease [Staphylococcus equorum]|uniref:ATP-dependent nuclease n=1 Tax=Staphylococcus equorum TaxID=246432 RepID=UPI0008538FC7|nr:TOPRIM nucleotidyl transferase/hydrolase domain-containing protein [Staphylococcus equorum]OEK68615.1 hypothetical protein AST02_08235 [Staphylococcus equorum]
MFIKKLKIKNFKQFKYLDLNLNPKRNIFIGENGAGKSSIIEGISYVLSGNDKVIEKVGKQSLFNTEIINDFLACEREDRKYNDLPVLSIEIFIDSNTHFELEGKHNSEGKELSGLVMKIKPNDTYSEEINESLQESDTFPFDYYKIEFKTFDGRNYNSYKRYLRYSFIDSSRINSANANQRFIENIYKKEVSLEGRIRLQHEYRKQTENFSNKELNLHNKGDYDLSLSSHRGRFLEENLTIRKENVDISQLGKGDHMFFNIDFSLSRSQQDSNIVLIEEPENHLSHLNMHKLIQKMVEAEENQVFIATHSNMITTRLDLQNAIFLANGSAIKLEDLDDDTARFFMKAPDTNVLDFILSNKIILVEGNAEYILLSSLFKRIFGTELYNKNIAIISVGGLSFKRYLNIALELEKKVAVITDNDGDYKKNILDLYNEYQADNIQVFAPKDNEDYTFEVSIYKNNISLLDYNLKTPQMSNGLQAYMLDNKAESAFRILEKIYEDEFYNDFTIPEHLWEAYRWIN